MYTQVPSVTFIEMAADSIGTMPDDFKNDQLEELKSFGDGRAQSLGASGLSPDFILGYSLGLEVARVLLAGMPKAVENGVEL